MKIAWRLFSFFIYSNLFIAICAVLMIDQTTELLLNEWPPFAFTAFAFFATMCSYSFHWWLTPDIDIPSSRLRWLRRNKHVHLVLFFISLPGVIYYAILLIDHWQWLLVA